MSVRIKVTLAPLGPAKRELHRLLGTAAFDGKLRALVEGHDDIGPKRNLRLHGALRREQVGGTVEVRAELHALFADFAQLAQAEHLKPAGIGEQRPLPGHEFVQSAKLPHLRRSRTKIKMISITQEQFHPKLLQHILGNSFDRAERAAGHEDWGLHRSVWSDDPSRAGRPARGFDLKRERH